MKLLYLTHSRIPTQKAHGLQVMVMCEAFAAAGAEVSLVVPDKRNFTGEDPFAYYGVTKNFSITRLPISDFGSRWQMFNALFFWLDVWSFARALRRCSAVHRSDVLYTRDYPLLFALPRARAVVLELHSIPKRGWLFNRALARTTHVVAITQALKDDLVALGVDPNKITVAPDGVNVRLFEHQIMQQEARQRLGLPHEGALALYVGALGGWKGTETLVAAAEGLAEPQVALVGADAAEVPVLSKKYPYAHFVAYLPYRELPRVLAAADLLVLPNTARQEISARYTSPLKLFAYMASGKPIICSDVPSIREVLDDSSALFFKSDDPADLREKLRYALAHKDEMAARAKRALELVQHYTWDKRAEQILTFLG